MVNDRATVTGLYVRVCRDSGFNLPYDQAAHLVADILGIHAIKVWDAFGDLHKMTTIAAGTHPICHAYRHTRVAKEVG